MNYIKDFAFLVVSVAYGIYITKIGIESWGTEAGIGFVLTIPFLTVISLIYSVIIGSLGWNKLRNIEVGFIIGFLANWFALFSVGQKHSLSNIVKQAFQEIVPFDYSNGIHWWLLPLIPLSLLYIFRLIYEYKRRKQEMKSTNSIFYRCLGWITFGVIVFAGSVYL